MTRSYGKERKYFDDLARFAQLIYAKGWVANHDGNLSVRSTADRIIATPTATSKGDVTTDLLLVVDGDGNKLSGKTRSFSELKLHLAIYGARPDAKAVVHAHPPSATAMACAGVPLGRPFLPEAIVSIGDDVPMVPFAGPGTKTELAGVAAAATRADVFTLENHGVIALGDDVEQAFLRVELVEHLATIASRAMPWGGVRRLPDDLVETLLAKRARAGLGPAARGVKPVPGPTTRIASAGPGAVASGGVDRKALEQAIARELRTLID